MPDTYVVDLPAGMTQRGFWLYVWQVPVDGQDYHYVGRTGDNSSPFASSVYQRLGQHLGQADNTNALLRHLRRRWRERDIWDFDSFRMISYGPVFPEVERHIDFRYREPPHWQDARDRHYPFRDRVAKLEAHLAHQLTAAGYEVLNEFGLYQPPSSDDWIPVLKAFGAHFPSLDELP